jgi:predicted DCC family thiol-disulfide oxidoreductase YuxK
MFFAPLQGDYARSVITRHPDLRGVDSLVFVEPCGLERDERVFVRSDAALHVVSCIGGLWRVALVAYIIPRVVRDFLYDQFAKRRYRWFGRYETCLLPTAETRSRFLD